MKSKSSAAEKVVEHAEKIIAPIEQSLLLDRTNIPTGAGCARRADRITRQNFLVIAEAEIFIQSLKTFLNSTESSRPRKQSDR